MQWSHLKVALRWEKKKHKDLVKPIEGYKTLPGLSDSFHRHRERPCDTLQFLFSVKGNT